MSERGEGWRQGVRGADITRTPRMAHSDGSESGSCAEEENDSCADPPSEGTGV